MWYVQSKDASYKYTVFKYKVHDKLAITYNFTNLHFLRKTITLPCSHFSANEQRKGYMNLCCSSSSVFTLRTYLQMKIIGNLSRALYNILYQISDLD